MSRLKPILTSLSPNTEWDDILVAARTLVTPHRWQRHMTKIATIEQQLAGFLGLRHITLTSSGRGALYEALRAANIGAGDEVILQAFTCLAVPAAITWAGAKPVYADIGAEYNLTPTTVKPHITSRTRALIVQHTFGIPAPIKELVALARLHNLLIIEDVAHALGGMVEGQPLGSFGDVAVLSFGRDKTISSVYGGALATRTGALHVAIRKQISRYPQPPRWWSFQQLLHPLIVNVALPFYFTAGLGKIMLVVAQRLKLISMAVSAEEKKLGRMPAFIRFSFSAALAPLLEKQVQKLARFTAHRQRIAQQYLEQLPHTSSLKNQAAQANWLRFPLRVKEKRRLFTAAKRNRILLGDWYTTPVAPSALEQHELTQYTPGSCPEAERAAQEVINLPTHIRLTKADLERIITVVKKYD